MRLSIAQIGPCIGDVEGNTRMVREMIEKAARDGADLVVFPELTLCGHPAGNILSHDRIGERCEKAVGRLARDTRDGPAILVGLAGRAPDRDGLTSTMALLAGGEIGALVTKRSLRQHGRIPDIPWFVEGTGPVVTTVSGTRIGIAAGADVLPPSTMSMMADEGVAAVLCSSGSHFTIGHPDERQRIIGTLAARQGVPIVWVNQVCGNDGLVFDGSSFAVDARGKTVVRAAMFSPDLITVDLDSAEGISGPLTSHPEDREQILHDAACLGIRDFVHRSGFDSVVVGASGGIDSSLVLALAARALGREAVTAISMPSRFTSRESRDDTRALVENLGVKHVEIPVEPAFEALIDSLSPHFGDRPFDTTEENLQARIRGTLLMSYANKLGGLVLATGNRSEISVGYCTLYGDTVGALAPIGDLYKRDVRALARWIDRESEIIPRNVIERAPSAELRADQKDEDTLPPYDLLDRVLAATLDEHLGPDAIVERGIAERETVERILSMIRASEFKRYQSTVILRLASPRGPGRAFPIAHEFGS